MTSMTTRSIVDQMTAELAERRHQTIYRHTAYVALARAILGDDTSELPKQYVPDWRTSIAA